MAPGSQAPAASTSAPEFVRKITELLAAGKPHEALQWLARESSEWARNARAVCFLRQDDPQAAVDTLRGLVVNGHLSLRAEAPLNFKTNFATALLLSGNIIGGKSVLAEFRNEADDKAQRLRDAIQKWKASMSFGQKLRWWLGGELPGPFTVDYPAGDIE